MKDKHVNKIVAHETDKWEEAIESVQRKLAALRLRQAELSGILKHFREMKKAGEPWPKLDI